MAELEIPTHQVVSFVLMPQPRAQLKTAEAEATGVGPLNLAVRLRIENRSSRYPVIGYPWA